MADRWTLEELENTDNITFAACILNERRNKLSPYSPLAAKLKAAEKELDAIKEAKDRYIREVIEIPERITEEEKADEVQDGEADRI